MARPDEFPTILPAVVRPPNGPLTVVLTLQGVITPETVPDLCENVREVLARTGADSVTCDVGGLTDLDLAVVETLARLQLTARAYGGSVRLRHASPQLRALLALVGLPDVLPCCPDRPEGGSGEGV